VKAESKLVLYHEHILRFRMHREEEKKTEAQNFQLICDEIFFSWSILFVFDLSKSRVWDRIQSWWCYYCQTGNLKW